MTLATVTKPISNILLCDDHPFIQAGLEITFRNFLSLSVKIHKAHDGKMALDLAETHKPDFAVVDLELPDMTGIEIIKELRELSPQTKILVLTNCQTPSTLRQVYALNVQAISHKSSSMEEFSTLFEKIMSSKSTVLDSYTSHLLEQNKHLHFTPKELEVLEKMVRGYTNQKIADEIGCALTTVRFHRANIMQKGGFRNAAEVTAWFLKGQSQANSGS